MSTSNVFSEASKLRKKHPRKFSDWQDYVDWATQLRKGKGKKKASPAAPKRAKKKASRAARVGATKSKPMGSIAFHKSQARKQLEEQLAWLLLARDQEKRKAQKRKLNKKVVELRRQLQHLK